LLIRFGYECVDIVESVGEFSIRGEVIDIYGVNMDDPIRILLFGDEVESIRNYNTATQISNKAELSEAEIAKRRAEFKPVDKALTSRWLRQYRKLVTNASNGAVLEA